MSIIDTKELITHTLKLEASYEVEIPMTSNEIADIGKLENWDDRQEEILKLFHERVKQPGELYNSNYDEEWTVSDTDLEEYDEYDHYY